jgi:hypothetical protein
MVVESLPSLSMVGSSGCSNPASVSIPPQQQQQQPLLESSSNTTAHVTAQNCLSTQLSSRLDRTTVCLPIVHGSVAFYLGKKAENKNEYQSHQWTLYLRGLNNEDLSHCVQKVVFHLHPSFAQPIRELTQPPFEVTEKGWGEFEAQIRIYWKDSSELTTMVRSFDLSFIFVCCIYSHGTALPSDILSRLHTVLSYIHPEHLQMLYQPIRKYPSLLKSMTKSYLPTQVKHSFKIYRL